MDARIVVVATTKRNVQQKFSAIGALFNLATSFNLLNHEENSSSDTKTLKFINSILSFDSFLFGIDTTF